MAEECHGSARPASGGGISISLACTQDKFASKALPDALILVPNRYQN